MSLNVLNGKFARSAKAFFDSVHMGAGLNVGELLRVKGRRRSVSLKEHRGFFPSPGRNDIHMSAFSVTLLHSQACHDEGLHGTRASI